MNHVRYASQTAEKQKPTKNVNLFKSNVKINVLKKVTTLLTEIHGRVHDSRKFGVQTS